MWEIWDRVVKNWATSSAAIIAGVVIIAKWFGYIVVPDEIITVIIAVQAFILLLSKD